MRQCCQMEMERGDWERGRKDGKGEVGKRSTNRVSAAPSGRNNNLRELTLKEAKQQMATPKEKGKEKNNNNGAVGIQEGVA